MHLHDRQHDCRNRGQDQTWFWVILCFQPLGAWAYFVAVKLRFTVFSLGRYRAASSPSRS